MQEHKSSKRKADVKAIETRLRKEMRNIGFGLRGQAKPLTERMIDRDFDQVCRSLDKTHHKFKDVLVSDKSISREFIKKYYGLDYTSKFQRILAF